MRLPAATDLESRDGTLTKGSLVTNGFIEASGPQDPMPKVRKRPGMTNYGFIRAGTAQTLAAWNGIKTVIGDYYSSGTGYTTGYTNATTWNPADITANCTLSGANLTAATTAVTYYNGVRSSFSISSGVWYFEVTVNTVGVMSIGFAPSTHNMLFTGPSNYVSYYSTGAVGTTYGGVVPSGVPSYIAAAVIGCLYDATNGIIQFYKNGVNIGSTTVPPGTAMYAYFASFNAISNITARFSGGFTYTPTVSSTALVVNTVLLPFSYSSTNSTPATQYFVFKNSEYMWYATSAGVVTRVADADYPGNMTPARNTVPGIVYLDTYFLVMDVDGRVYNSASNDPSTWTALGVITAQYENGAGVAIAKSQEYLACFKEYSVELFYDAGNPVGSPLSRVDNGFFKVGCASGTSIADIKGQIFWISQSKEKGRSVHVMNGTQNSEVATASIQRILNKDDLATVYAYGARLDGHDLYIITLVTTGVTLAYDLDSQKWYRLSGLTLGSDFVSGATITLTRTGDVATYTMGSGAHGLSDGDPVLLAGWTQTEYNGIHQISYISAQSFSFKVSGTPATPATSGGATTGKAYTESYFPYTKYTNYSGYDLFLHGTNGYLYIADPTVYQDDGVPINYKTRSQKLDGGDSGFKFMANLTMVGEQVSDTAMVRWTDDDYQTYNAYRMVDLSNELPQVRRCGQFRRRAIETRHIGNTRPVYEALEMEFA